jgi:hypothetical protein
MVAEIQFRGERRFLILPILLQGRNFIEGEVPSKYTKKNLLEKLTPAVFQSLGKLPTLIL